MEDKKRRSSWSPLSFLLGLTLLLVAGIFLIFSTAVAAEQTSYDCASGSHPYEVEIKTPAKEDQEGSRVYTCTWCGYTFEERIPKYGHTWSEWQVQREATCEEEGLWYRYCVVCDQEDGRQEKVLAALPHQYGEWQTIQKAEVGVEGKEERICIYGCGEKEEKSIPEIPEMEALPEEKEKVLSEKEKPFPKKRVSWSACDTLLVGGGSLLVGIYGILIYSDVVVLLWYRKLKKRRMAVR